MKDFVCIAIKSLPTRRIEHIKDFFYNPATSLWLVSDAPLEAPQEKYVVDDDLPPASSEESTEDFDGESPPCSNPAFSDSETSFSDDNSPQQSDQGAGWLI